MLKRMKVRRVEPQNQKKLEECGGGSKSSRTNDVT